MEAPKPNPNAGERLRELRLRLGLTTRDVEARSLRIADEKRSREYYLSHTWLADIETGKFTPGIYKFYSLSAVYHRSIIEILSYFGMRISDLERDRRRILLPRTHLLAPGADLEGASVSLPVRFRSEFQLEKTNLLARVIEKWDRIPVALLQHIDLEQSVYGYIGLEDYTLYPLIRPGSLVQIDSRQRRISAQKWQTEFDRPIYFVELREGYVCGWCQLDRGQMMIVPHPHSPQGIRRFDYPSEAEIVGRVTGVAMRIVAEHTPASIVSANAAP